MQNILIAGFGFMGSTHAQIFAQLRQAKLTAIFDLDRERAAALARRVGVTAPIYDDFDRAVAERPVDAVDICLPVIYHGAYIRKSIKLGKHIFCEKPLATDARESAAVAAAAGRAGIIMQVGLCVRFWPEYQALEAHVRGGRMGRLLSLSLQRRGGSLTAKKLRVFTPGGPGLDTHLHDTDFIHHLLGRPRAVSSIGIPQGRGCSHLFTLYHFERVAVTAEGGHSYPVPWRFYMAFQAVFERGTIEYDSRADPTLMITEGDGPRRPLEFSRPVVPPSNSGIGATTEMAGFHNELSYFIDCLERGRAPAIASARQAADSMRTVCAEIRSARTGRTINLVRRARGRSAGPRP